MADYFVSNSNSTLFWNEQLRKYRFFQDILSRNEKCDSVFNDVRFVDVSNAKTIIENDDPVCPQRTVITNRKVLLQFLQKMEGTEYKFLFIDVELNIEDSTSSDDAELVGQLLKMKNIAIGKVDDFVLMAKDWLDTIAYDVNYDCQSFDHRFTKYEYVQNDKPSIALKMYRDATNGEHGIKKFGLLYFDRWRLAYNSKSLVFYKYYNEYDYEIEGLMRDTNMWKEFSGEIEDNYVIIGNMQRGGGDMVGTYMDDQPGPIVNWIAFKTLMNGGHKIKPLYVLIMLCTYFFITLLILCPEIITKIRRVSIKKISRIRVLSMKRKLFHRISNFLNAPIVLFLLSFVKYGIVLELLSFVLFIRWDIFYSPLLPTLLFPVVENYRNYKQNSIIQNN